MQVFWEQDKHKKLHFMFPPRAGGCQTEEKLGKSVHVRCYAHKLNLPLKLPTLSKLPDRVMCLTLFFHCSTTAKQQLEEKQRVFGLLCHKVKTGISNWWSSDYVMVDRYLEQQPLNRG